MENTTTITAQQLRKESTEYLNRVYYTGQAYTIVKSEKNAKPFAALVPMHVLDRLAELEALLSAQAESGQSSLTDESSSVL
ncbi:hypothetical protein GCM10027347_53500 [Larkinella harenae]